MYCTAGLQRRIKIKGLFTANWRGVKLLGCLHHVVDGHDWGLGQCDHGDLVDDETRPAYLEKCWG